MPTMWRVPLWMGCFEEEMKHCLWGVKRHPFFVSFLEKVAKLWPKLGYKRKKILLFRSFWTTCKISLVPGTGLEPAHLAIHAPETCASTNSATRAGRIPISRNLVLENSDCRQLFLSGAQDKTWTCTPVTALPPQSSVSTNSTTWACLELKIES